MSNTGGRRRPPTIHDVAREAGVSRGTVSRVLNGGHYVSPAAQEAVNAAIRRTGYVVNRHARSLITGRSDSVGFLLTEPQEKFFEDPNFNILLRGCTQALAAHDIPLLLMLAYTEDERRRITRYITSGHVDGVLLVSSHSGNPVAEELSEAGVPLVACGKPIGLGSKISYVAADDREGARDMTRHLLSLGRRRIGTVTGPLDTPGGVERLAGYKEVLAEAGIEVDERLVVSGDYSRLQRREGCRAAARPSPGPGRRVRRLRPDGAGRAHHVGAGRAARTGGRGGRRLRRLPRRTRVQPRTHHDAAALRPDQRGDGAGAAGADRGRGHGGGDPAHGVGEAGVDVNGRALGGVEGAIRRRAPSPPRGQADGLTITSAVLFALFGSKTVGLSAWA